MLLFHLVFPAKHRWAVFNKDIDKTLKEICISIEKCYQIIFLEMYIQWSCHLVQSVPTYNVTKIVTMIKSLTATKRTPFNSFDIAVFRPCVLLILCWNTFTLVNPLPSTISSGIFTSSFNYFISTMELSDSNPRAVLVTNFFFPSRSKRGGDLSILVHKISIHARSLRPRRIGQILVISFLFMLILTASSILVRLNTFPTCGSINASSLLYSNKHMTLGHHDWLDLQCTTLSFAILCRFIPTLSVPW